MASYQSGAQRGRPTVLDGPTYEPRRKVGLALKARDEAAEKAARAAVDAAKRALGEREALPANSTVPTCRNNGRQLFAFDRGIPHL